jgi:hypothetical protein
MDLFFPKQSIFHSQTKSSLFLTLYKKGELLLLSLAAARLMTIDTSAPFELFPTVRACELHAAVHGVNVVHQGSATLEHLATVLTVVADRTSRTGATNTTYWGITAAGGGGGSSNRAQRQGGGIHEGSKLWLTNSFLQ